MKRNRDLVTNFNFRQRWFLKSFHDHWFTYTVKTKLRKCNISRQLTSKDLWVFDPNSNSDVCVFCVSVFCGGNLLFFFLSFRVFKDWGFLKSKIQVYTKRKHKLSQQKTVGQQNIKFIFKRSKSQKSSYELSQLFFLFNVV